jgi:hypothetical protein
MYYIYDSLMRSKDVLLKFNYYDMQYKNISEHI